jgi:hypothetical protein
MHTDARWDWSIQNYREPAQADVKLLRGWADDACGSLDADEMACIVITAHIELRKVSRENGSASNAIDGSRKRLS